MRVPAVTCSFCLVKMSKVGAPLGIMRLITTLSFRMEKTELAKDLTVDQILHDSDTAVITAYFLLPRNEFEVLGGQITVTVNASKTKHFSIPPQRSEGWSPIYAAADD